MPIVDSLGTTLSQSRRGSYPKDTGHSSMLRLSDYQAYGLAISGQPWSDRLREYVSPHDELFGQLEEGYAGKWRAHSHGCSCVIWRQEQVIVLLSYRGGNPLMQHVRRGYAASTTSNHDAEHGDRGHQTRGSQGRIEAPYRDEIASEAGDTEDVTTAGSGQRDAGGGNQRYDSNMMAQPSSIQGHENEWRS
ncbi:MAG: hypothetical protein Q9166_005856 [cf. Caloplaca sp. 2 TL-2023]